MFSFSRVTLLAVCLFLLSSVSLGANVGWTYYSGTACNGNSVWNSNDGSASAGSVAGQNTIVSGCQQTTALGGTIKSVQLNCLSGGSLTQNTAAYYSDTACSPASIITTASGAGTGSGACFNTTGIANAQSASITCSNGAFAVAALSLPLMALLALIATIMA